MIETTDAELDVEQLMVEIRASVAKREASGNRSLVDASVDLYNLLSTIVEPRDQRDELPLLKLQPEFSSRKDNHYHVNDLLQYQDATFVWNAYRAILGRAPDEPGLRAHLNKLRSGRFNKIDILASLRFSAEGRQRAVRIDGLTTPALIRRLYRVPIFGYVLEMLVGIARLPSLIRSKRQFEGHALAQQQLLAERINDLIQTGSQIADSFSQELSGLFDEQRSLALLQHQQVMALFSRQRDIIREWKNIRDRVGIPSGQPDERLRTLSRSPQSIEQQSLTDGKRHDLDEFFASFAEQFRGNRKEIKEGLKHYLAYVTSAAMGSDILDLGCGRGEWLELVKEAGFEGRGIETNRKMVEQARGLGLEVIEEEALDYLRSQPDLSLSLVTGFHFIEHLSFETLIELLDEIKRTLKPGGLIIFETPNPKNLTVAACNFYSDPTHQKPVFPETLQLILQHKAFTDIRLEYLNPVKNGAGVEANQWPQTLQGLFFGPRDFAVICQKAGSVETSLKTSRES